MVVVVIAGILVTMAVLSLGDHARQKLEDEARQLHAWLMLLQDTSLIEGRTLGLRLHDHDIEALQPAREGTWVPFDADARLREHTLPEDMTLRLYLDGEAASIPSEPPEQPQILLWSSGEITPFELWLANSAGKIALDNPGAGPTRMGAVQESDQ